VPTADFATPPASGWVTPDVVWTEEEGKATQGPKGRAKAAKGGGGRGRVVRLLGTWGGTVVTLRWELAALALGGCL
jgi:hypothetical protein